MRDPLGAGDADGARHHARCAACRSPRATARLWRAWSAGALFGFEFVLIYRGLLYTTASRAVLFIYLAPFFVAIGARWFFPGERFGLMQWFGLLLAFVGMVVAFGVPAPAAAPHQLLGDVMMAAAAVVLGRDHLDNQGKFVVAGVAGKDAALSDRGSASLSSRSAH